MSQKNNHEVGEREAVAGVIGEGDWNYLREHLDHPRFLALPLGSHLSPQTLGGLGVRLSAWLTQRWRHPETPPARLVALARLPLGPRQAVTMVEADGTRVLVGTSAEGAPTFMPLPATGKDSWIEPVGPRSESAVAANLAMEADIGSNWDGSLTQAASAHVSSMQQSALSAIARAGSSMSATATSRRRNSGSRRTSVSGRVSW